MPITRVFILYNGVDFLVRLQSGLYVINIEPHSAERSQCAGPRQLTKQCMLGCLFKITIKQWHPMEVGFVWVVASYRILIPAFFPRSKRFQLTDEHLP